MYASFNRIARVALGLVGLALPLAGCGQDKPEAQDPNSAVLAQFVSRGQVLSAPITESKSPAPSFAVLTLPSEAMRGGKLREKQYTNGWRQSIALGGGNDLTVEMAAEVATAAQTTYKPNMLRLYKPTAEGIRREILSRFKGVPMRIVGRPMSNALGQYGVAVGAGAGGIRCVFAWQWVDNLAAAARGERGTYFDSGELPASIRMRLCRAGVTADQLADWYSGLQISDPAQVARIANALQRNAEIAVASNGAPSVVEPSESLEATLITAPRGGGGAPRRHVAKKRTGNGGGDAPSYVPPGGAPAPLTGPASPNVDGKQFLAPPAQTGYAPGVGQGVVYNTPKPDPTLPSQAYRGPAGSRAIVAPPSGGAPVYLGPAKQ